jgi:hypothetical protein
MDHDLDDRVNNIVMDLRWSGRRLGELVSEHGMSSEGFTTTMVEMLEM